MKDKKGIGRFEPKAFLSKAGKEAVLAILGKGEIFGQNVLAGELQSAISVTAVTDCSIMRLDQALLARMLKQEPRLSEFFISYLLRRGIRMQEDLVDHLFNSSERRLARALLLLANFGQQDTPEAVIATINQETLAEMIGTTRSRVSTFMNKFRRLGFIDYNGGVRVHRSLLNVILHD